jgi:hypothetical protein
MAARKRTGNVCRQSPAETFCESRIKELAANIMQEVGDRRLFVNMWAEDYLGVNGRQGAISASRHGKQWIASRNMAKVYSRENKRLLDK